MNTTYIVISYLLGINIVTFIIYGIDKLKAKKGWWRIPEATLLLLALVGGSIGAWVGMKMWHHKTMHKKFKYGVPAILIFQIGAVVACIMLTSCSGNRQIINQEMTQMTGAYTNYRDVTQDDKILFDATYKGDIKLTPLKVMTQVVAGTNFRFLCSDGKGSNYEVAIFRALPSSGGKAEVRSVKLIIDNYE